MRVWGKMWILGDGTLERYWGMWENVAIEVWEEGGDLFFLLGVWVYLWKRLFQLAWAFLIIPIT